MSVYSDLLATHSPLGAWWLEDAATAGIQITDNSGNARHGGWLNGASTDPPTASAPIVEGTSAAADMKGAAPSSGSITHGSWMNVTTAFTLIAWIRPDTSTFATTSQLLIRDDSATSGSSVRCFRLQIPTTGVPELQFWLGEEATVAKTLTATSAVVAGSKYMLAFTFNGSIGRFYVNGVEVDSEAASGQFPVLGDPSLFFGGQSTAAYDGSMAHAAYLGSTLTATQIADLYTAGTPFVAPELTGNLGGSGTFTAAVVPVFSRTASLTGSSSLTVSARVLGPNLHPDPQHLLGDGNGWWFASHASTLPPGLPPEYTEGAYVDKGSANPEAGLGFVMYGPAMELGRAMTVGAWVRAVSDSGWSGRAEIPLSMVTDTDDWADYDVFPPRKIVQDTEGWRWVEWTLPTIDPTHRYPTADFYAYLTNATPGPEGGKVRVYATGVEIRQEVWPAAPLRGSGSFTATVQATPANDNFASAHAVPIVTTGDTYTSAPVPSALATTEAGEPSAHGSTSNKSCWWSYTPLTSGTATISTVGSFQTENPSASAADTQMAIYTGSALGSLTTVTTDEDSGGSHGGKQWTSWKQMAVTAGVTYWVQVGTWPSSPALTYVCNVTGPASVAPPAELDAALTGSGVLSAVVEVVPYRDAALTGSGSLSVTAPGPNLHPDPDGSTGWTGSGVYNTSMPAGSPFSTGVRLGIYTAQEGVGQIARTKDVEAQAGARPVTIGVWARVTTDPARPVDGYAELRPALYSDNEHSSGSSSGVERIDVVDGWTWVEFEIATIPEDRRWVSLDSWVWSGSALPGGGAVDLHLAGLEIRQRNVVIAIGIADGPLAGSGVFTAVVDSAAEVDAALSGSGALTATVETAPEVTADLSGSGELTAMAEGSVTPAVVGALSGAGLLSGEILVVEIHLLPALLAGAGYLGADVHAVNPSTPTIRWKLRDTATNVEWTMPINPDSMSSPLPRRSLKFGYGWRRDGRVRTFAGPGEAREWEWSGAIRTKEHYDRLVEWAEKSVAIDVTDHLGRTFRVFIVEFNPIDRRSTPNTPWRLRYTMKTRVLERVG